VLDFSTKTILKEQILNIIEDTELEEVIFIEICEIVRILLDYCFPKSWPELNAYCLEMFSNTCNKILGKRLQNSDEIIDVSEGNDSNNKSNSSI